MKLCKTCGAPMDDEATFCPMCGSKNENNNANEETTVLNPNDVPTYINVSQQLENTKQKKKLNKGVIAIIIILAILVLAGIGSFAEKYIQNSQYRDEYSFSNNDLKLDSYDSDAVKLFEFGTVKDGIYSNDFADLHITLPSEEWTFMSSEEIISNYLQNGSLDTVNDKVYLENDSEKSYFDMVMYNTVTNENIQVQLMQGLTYTHKNSSAQDMLNALLSQSESQYSSMGYVVTDKSKYDDSIYIGMNEYYTASLTIELSDNATTCQKYAVTKIGEDTFVVIAISGSDTYLELSELLYQFY